jgi:hypothetical protein
MVEENLAAGLEALRGPVTDLVASAGLASRFNLIPLRGGANNRVFCLEGADGSKALLKAYFQHAGDQRDRVGAEFAFATFAWNHHVSAVPRPLACDARNRLALYEFIPGRQLQPGEVSQDVVQQALAFATEINRHKRSERATSLPRASESCFSVAHHLGCVERRMERLEQIEGSSGIDAQAARFVRTDLSNAWQEILIRTRRLAAQLGVNLEAEIDRQDRCLSPSDFGFHNAILTEGGQVRFIDFEYAGWDDPAKMVCDFFCQQKVPVPLTFYEGFVRGVVAELSSPGRHAERIDLLMPVCRVKWCCILLNEFLPEGRERRRFATEISNEEGRKARQLEMARGALQQLTAV